MPDDAGATLSVSRAHDLAAVMSVSNPDAIHPGWGGPAHSELLAQPVQGVG
jgi:muramoyltetrapeptide carboxypeptidase LdcA involved in peptidoglycan recycling